MHRDAMLDEREFLHQAADRLRSQFTGTFGPETIEGILSDSLARLSDGARITAFLPLLAERFAKERLLAAAKTQGSDMTDKPTVLFLCVHNAGRSQMAAGWLQHLAGDRVTVLSGGSTPAEQVNPDAVEVMREVGIDIADSYPKPWTEETLGASDVIVTMGCGDACPVIPGKRYVDWELADPAGKPVDQIRPIRDEIRERVRQLIGDLDLDAVETPARSEDDI